MTPAPPSPNNVGGWYWDDPYYQSDEYLEKLAAAERQEAARQALMRGEATPQTLAYARFLVAVANDATINDATINGGGFNADDADVAREYPFLRPLIEGQSK